MKGVSLVLLVVVYAVAMATMMLPVAYTFGLSDDTLMLVGLSFCLSVLGVLGGFGVVQLQRLSRQRQRMLKIALFTVYPVVLAFTYFVFGPLAFLELCLLFLKLVFVLLLCAIPMLVTYGLLKKKKNAVLAPSTGIMVLFFFTLLLRTIPNSRMVVMDDLWVSFFFFVGYVVFLELALSSLFFSSVVERLAPKGQGSEFLLGRFGRVLNGYALFLGATVVVSVGLAGGVLVLKDLFVGVNPVDFLGVTLGSMTGIFIFVVVTVCCLLLFWLFSPLRKAQSSFGPKKPVA